MAGENFFGEGGEGGEGGGGNLCVVKTRPVNVPVKEEPLTELGLRELSLFESSNYNF